MATYTQGIRKVFLPESRYGHIDTLFLWAEQAGFSLVSHNGLIWARVEKDEWVKTTLTIEDFQAS